MIVSATLAGRQIEPTWHGATHYSVAEAVKAMIGTFGNSCRSLPSWL
jgi:hypothetical protein